MHVLLQAAGVVRDALVRELGVHAEAIHQLLVLLVAAAGANTAEVLVELLFVMLWNALPIFVIIVYK